MIIWHEEIYLYKRLTFSIHRYTSRIYNSSQSLTENCRHNRTAYIYRLFDMTRQDKTKTIKTKTRKDKNKTKARQGNNIVRQRQRQDKDKDKDTYNYLFDVCI